MVPPKFITRLLLSECLLRQGLLDSGLSLAPDTLSYLVHPVEAFSLWLPLWLGWLNPFSSSSLM